jgi:LmbE family N-acetylglucosaminyl deacetylase
MAELSDRIPDTVLAVYAHPDDPEIACGGTLATWAAAGAQVHVVIVCAGDKGSHDAQDDPTNVAAVRSAEVAAAAAALGLAGQRVLGYPDGEVDESMELRGALVGAIRSLRPDAVVCPDPTAAFFGRTYVNHRDHRVVGWATLDAVAPAEWSPLYFPAAGPPHHVQDVYLSGSLQPDVFVDITSALDAKTAALRCHVSQLGGSDEVMAAAVRRRAEEAGRMVGVAYAEGFRLLTPS